MTQEQEKLLAVSKGFTCHPDPNRGAGWCKFSKHLLHVWRAHGGKWQTAIKVFNHYKGHGLFDTLEEALNRYVFFHLYFEKQSKGRYYCNATSFGWEFTIEWHHVKQAWYGEAIQSGRNKWPEKYYSDKEQAAKEMAFFMKHHITYPFQVTFSDGKLPTSQSRRVAPCQQSPLCECGAKHTQNPNYHLSFCPLNPKNQE